MSLSVLTPTGWEGMGSSAPSYTRPANWLPTTVTAGEQKIQTLIGVGAASDPASTRQMTILAAGAYTVDWGDGTAPENFTSIATAKHLYTGTGLTALGGVTAYQALVTVTPQSGNLTRFDLTQPYDAGKNWRPSALEVVVGPGTITDFAAGGVGVSVAAWLERIEFKSTIVSAPVLGTASSLWFQGCAGLREIVGTITSTGTDLSYVFSNCFSLQKFPDVIHTAKPASIQSLFSACYLMTEVPSWVASLDTSLTTTFANMFNNCYRLTSIPALNTVSGTNFSSMISGCYTLTSVPALSTANGTNFSSMFSNCFQLQSLPTLNTSNGTNFNSMFSSCRCVEVIPALDITKATDVGSMFSNCPRLVRIEGTLNFSAATTLTSLFSTCYGLRQVTFNPGPKLTFTLVGSFDAATLDAIYTSLPTVSGQTITVSSIPGTLGDDPTIATAKGWTVTGS